MAADAALQRVGDVGKACRRPAPVAAHTESTPSSHQVHTGPTPNPQRIYWRSPWPQAADGLVAAGLGLLPSIADFSGQLRRGPSVIDPLQTPLYGESL